MELVTDSINRAFSKQSAHYDADDRSNVVLQNLRQQVYQHVNQFLKPQTKILELNAGTGIDATYFVSQGHHVHAIDIAEGMIHQIEMKIRAGNLHDRLTCEQLSFTELGKLSRGKFDYVLSNFGGLNCARDLREVTAKLRTLLNPGAYVTWVIMPPVCLWEILSLAKGSREALRRFRRKGTSAHLEGEYFKTYYHSLSEIKKAFAPEFSLVKSQGLAPITPPPHRGDFPKKYPRLYHMLKRLDGQLRNHYPFNRWADHIIVTFKANF